MLLLGKRATRLIVASLVLSAVPALAATTEPAESPKVKVIDGVVAPRRPLALALADAMQFLKKADGAYIPGRIDGELAGYFTSAFVNPDGTRSTRPLAYPARQHAYFICTFLNYYAYTGQREWLLRARDLADWNLAHSTPATALYANLPYSTTMKGQPGGGRDGDSIEPDKVAFLGTGYLSVYEATGEAKHLDGARKVAETLAKRQRDNGSWPFRVVPEDGKVQLDLGGAPVLAVNFFERLARCDDKPAYRHAGDLALKYMLATNVEKNAWGTYHEDVRPKEEGYLSAEPMSFTADYLFRHAAAHPEYVEMGRRVLARMEERLVHTDGHPAAPAPAVAEQAGFDHIMPGHTARYCLALADLCRAKQDWQARRRALSGLNATTYMQSPAGLFRTFFYSVKPAQRDKNRPDWYSQHLYTVCHILEAMSRLPEIAPDGEDHVLGSTVYLRDVRYAPGQVQFESNAFAGTVLKLSFAPTRVTVNGKELQNLEENTPAKRLNTAWSYNAKSHVLIVEHEAGKVEVR
jgi:hypothetical protein